MGCDIMNNENLIKLILKNKKCTQKELAHMVGVSPAQVSKWKSGEYISFEMGKRLKILADIGDRDPDVVLWTGGVEQADKWSRLIKHLAETARENCETGYITYPLVDELDFLDFCVMSTLKNIGVQLPKEFPKDLDFNYESDYEEFEPDFEHLYYGNPHSGLIYQSFLALNDLYGFYAAYISDLFDHEGLELYDTSAVNIEPCLLNLAFCKIGKQDNFTPEFNQFRYQTITEYTRWIEELKVKALENNIPLKAELMNLLFDDHDSLGHEAEAESLGFNSRRAHPDIYMSEILESLRLIHQVLPVICKKLGITEDDFKPH